MGDNKAKSWKKVCACVCEREKELAFIKAEVVFDWIQEVRWEIFEDPL